MSIRAGVSLPGPFFLILPVGGPILGLLGLLILPMLFMVWLMVVFCVLMFRLIALIVGAVVPAAVNAGLHANDLRIEARNSRLTADEQAFIDSLGRR